MKRFQGAAHTVRCQCGSVELEADGQPMMTVACYCESCQKAGRFLETRPHAPPVLDEDGGTAFVMYRKDRIRCLQGQDRLREYRLQPGSKTRRVVADCCRSPMFLEFTNGHWLSLYKDRFAPDDRPPLEMRTMTADRRPGVEFSDGVPSPAKHSARFMWKLLTAWFAMGLRSPRIDYVRGDLNASR